MTITETLEKLDSLQAQIIHGPTVFADMAAAIREDRAKTRAALENCLNWTHRSIDLEVSGTMQMVAKQHAEEARAILDSENGGADEAGGGNQ